MSFRVLTINSVRNYMSKKWFQDIAMQDANTTEQLDIELSRIVKGDQTQLNGHASV